MSPTLMARVDGLPVQLLERERVWPVADRAARCRPELSARERARIERQEIRGALLEAGIL